MDANTDFIFPPDRFPSFQPKTDPPHLPEEFGPPLSFNPLGPDFEKHRIQMKHPGFQFVPTDDEIAGRKFEVSYNVPDNTYYDGKRCQKTDIGWERKVWRYCNIEMKQEHDWNMGYLARKDILEGKNTLPAMMEYRFNLKESGMKVKNLHLRLPFKLYRDGKVRVLVCSRDDYTILLDTQELKPVVRAQGWDDFVIRVELSGREGDVTYQNAQLFRQPLPLDRVDRQPVNPNWMDPFKVIIEME